MQLIDKHIAFIAEQGVSVTAGLGQVIGTKQNVFIEEAFNPISNHSIVKLSETFAVMQLLSQIDNNLENGSINNALSILNPIFDNIGKDDKQALETVLFNLEKLLSGKNDDSIKRIAIDDRNALYEKITE